MVTMGIDPHKQVHVAVAVDAVESTGVVYDGPL